MYAQGRQGYQQADNNAFVTIGRNDFCAVCMCDTLSTGRVVKRGLFYRASVVAEYRQV